MTTCYYLVMMDYVIDDYGNCGYRTFYLAETMAEANDVLNKWCAENYDDSNYCNIQLIPVGRVTEM